MHAKIECDTVLLALAALFARLFFFARTSKEDHDVGLVMVVNHREDEEANGSRQSVLHGRVGKPSCGTGSLEEVGENGL